MRSLKPLILLHFTQFSDSYFCIPEGLKACTGARHTPTTNIPCALNNALAINFRMLLTKGVSVLCTETDSNLSLAGRQASSVFSAAGAVKDGPCRGVKSCPTALHS